jgi:hypothetical protein
MKVLDLQCGQQHSFEGWFGSEDDFQSQLTRGLVECPLCGSAQISKKLSAPRFNLGKAVAPALSSLAESKNEVAVSSNPAASEQIQAQQSASRSLNLPNLPKSAIPPEVAAVMQAAWMDMAKHVMANTEDVGSSFASEARKIHYGEADERAIRGHATQDQTMELIEEGIDVMPLAIPESLKQRLN